MVRVKEAKVTLDDFAMFDARAAEGRAVAAAIDNTMPIPCSVTVRAHKFEDFISTLTPKRFQLLRLSKTGKRSIAELAVAAHRDPSGVSKDIAKLVDLGLVKVVIEPNAGHGTKRVVRAVAENIEIVSTL